MYVLAPSVFAADHEDLPRQAENLLRCGVSALHIDVMDGRFVPLKAFGPDTVRLLRQNRPAVLNVHLMTVSPELAIDEYADAGADVLIFHLEACKNPEAAVRRIHERKMHAGLALSPGTPLEKVSHQLWEEIDVLHIMTVQPGSLNQHFLPEMLAKIREARDKITAAGRKIRIEVDGDITLERLRYVLKAGAKIVVVGKAIFAGDIEQNVKKYLMQENAAGQAEGPDKGTWPADKSSSAADNAAAEGRSA